jgi:hypothetical protein
MSTPGTVAAPTDSIITPFIARGNRADSRATSGQRDRGYFPGVTHEAAADAARRFP